MYLLPKMSGSGIQACLKLACGWIRAPLLGLRNSIHHGTSSFLSTPLTDVDHVAPQLAFNIVHDAALHDTSRLNKMGSGDVLVGRSVGR